MSADWHRKKVIDLQEDGILLVEDGNHGEYRPRRHEFTASGTAFIRAADMNDGSVLFETAERINDEALGRIRKGIGKPGDILFSHKGTVGKLALLPLNAPPFVCSPQTTFWRCLDDTQLDRRFLHCFMRSSEFQDQWFARKGETDMADYVSLTAQRQLVVAIPPIAEQRAISDIVGALDDKIELNRQMNATLEGMARALFKSWFVDFDPVTAKAASRQPFGMSGDIAALFPDSFDVSPIGPLPTGWCSSTIGEAVKVVGGTTPSTKEPRFWEGGSIHWCTPRDMSRLADPVVLDTDRKITDAGLARISSGLLPAGSVLLSSRAPIGYLAIAEVPLAVNQGFIAMICEQQLPNHYVLRWTEESMDEILSRAGGTTFAEISKKSFRPIPVIVPSRPVLDAFVAKAGKWHEQVASNVRESAILAKTRDAVLPQLLSGEIRLCDAEKLVEEVA